MSQKSGDILRHRPFVSKISQSAIISTGVTICKSPTSWTSTSTVIPHLSADSTICTENIDTQIGKRPAKIRRSLAFFKKTAPPAHLVHTLTITKIKNKFMQKGLTNKKSCAIISKSTKYGAMAKR